MHMLNHSNCTEGSSLEGNVLPAPVPEFYFLELIHIYNFLCIRPEFFFFLIVVTVIKEISQRPGYEL